MRHRLAINAILIATLGIGCNSKPPSETRPKVIQSPAAGPVKALSSAPPADQQPAGHVGAAAPPAAKMPVTSSPAASTKDDPFAAEDLDNVFTISGEGPVATIGSADEVAAVDRVTLSDFDPAGDSTTFIVDAAPETAPNSTKSPNSQFPLPDGFVAVPSYGYSELGLPLRIRGGKSGVLMALVTGGAAKIGTNRGPEESQPEFEPFLDTFYMDINEVTLGQYLRFRDDIKEKKNTRVQLPVNAGGEDDLPALGVPWGNAQGFLNWAGKELPTEAEFEFAARGPEGWRTPWGDGRAIWPKQHTVDEIGPVQEFPTDQSQFGIFDLAGNAREWCSDLYSPTAHRDATSASAKLLRNWAGPKRGTVAGQRVVKGNGLDWSTWHREGRAGTEKHPDVGFRGVLRIRSGAGSAASGD